MLKWLTLLHQTVNAQNFGHSQQKLLNSKTIQLKKLNEIRS